MLQSETLTARPIESRPTASLARVCNRNNVAAQRSQRRRVVPVLAALNQPGSQSVPPAVDLNTAAWREPIAFLGGIFAGFLGLSLDQDPLKDWIQQTATDSQGMDSSTTAIVPVNKGPRV